MALQAVLQVTVLDRRPYRPARDQRGAARGSNAEAALKTPNMTAIGPHQRLTGTECDGLKHVALNPGIAQRGPSAAKVALATGDEPASVNTTEYCH